MKQFKAESKRLLDLMINSIYTHKEIFIRELISNASDAIDKLYFKGLSVGDSGMDRADFFIEISADKQERTLIIRDNGIGMTKDELENNLGVIAKSGSYAFKNENSGDSEKEKEIDIIGQFGVGFYSAFMVSAKVTVDTKAYGSDEAWRWTSSGVEGYTVEDTQMCDHGTAITLHIKENTDEENYDEFLEQYRITSLIKKYSDYIRYPIKMEMEKSRKKEDSDEYETYTEIDTINSMVPIWKKNKNEVEQEEYYSFYKEKFYDWQDPVRVIHSSTEGLSTYSALLFIPKTIPMDYYTREYEKGLSLYAGGVLIMEKCADLLPDYLSFVKGVVDSQDLSLNISREMLQHDRQLKVIAGRLEKKICAELLSMLTNEREKYEEFFTGFGLQLKYGMYDKYGMKKDEIKDLVLFYSSTENKMTTLKEYVERMKEGQQDIYYGCGESYDRIKKLPQAEALSEKGYEMLCLTDNVDEFALRILDKYQEKGFKNISSDNLDIESEEEKQAAQKLAKDNEELLKYMKEALSDKVVDVRVSAKLKSHPVCITTDGHITSEMEKVLNSMPAQEKVKAQRVLEINSEHAIFKALGKYLENDKERLAQYAHVLYDLALLIEGIAVDDPVELTRKICGIMSESGE